MSTKSKEELRQELITKRDGLVDEITKLEREQQRLEGLKRGHREQAATLSDQIDDLAPSVAECVRSYQRSQEKTAEERRVRMAETRARLATAGVSPEDVAEIAGDTKGRRR